MTPTPRIPRSLAPAALTLALTGAILLTAAPAKACVEIQVPVRITEPGHYCLARDFVGPLGPQPAIEIEADHVILDLRGHLIRNTTAPSNGQLGQGVLAWERSHIVVRNGSIAGFWEGVSLSQGFGGPARSTNHLVEDLRVYDCQRFGIGVGGNDSVVRRNVVWNIHGIGIESETSGLFVYGYRHRVLDNDVSRVVGSSDNRWGIRVFEGGNSIVRGNRLAATWNGILMEKTGSVYQDNVVVELPGGGVAYLGGIDAGNNLFY